VNAGVVGSLGLILGVEPFVGKGVGVAAIGGIVVAVAAALVGVDS